MYVGANHFLRSELTKFVGTHFPCQRLPSVSEAISTGFDSLPQWVLGLISKHIIKSVSCFSKLYKYRMNSPFLICIHVSSRQSF